MDAGRVGRPSRLCAAESLPLVCSCPPPSFWWSGRRWASCWPAAFDQQRLAVLLRRAPSMGRWFAPRSCGRRPDLDLRPRAGGAGELDRHDSLLRACPAGPCSAPGAPPRWGVGSRREAAAVGLILTSALVQVGRESSIAMTACCVLAQQAPLQCSCGAPPRWGVGSRREATAVGVRDRGRCSKPGHRLPSKPFTSFSNPSQMNCDFCMPRVSANY